MSLNDVPAGERVHIGIFGRRNAGKSSLINALTGQSVSVVSDVPGTTTDAVRKSMEILPLGPVVIIDTPGFDDEGTLGDMRVERTRLALTECDAALLVVDPEIGMGDTENELIRLFNENHTPYITVYSKSDIKPCDGLSVSAVTKDGINHLLDKLSYICENAETDRRIIGDLLSPGDSVILVTPIDSAAPKGRLILPQVQTLRDILDAGAFATVVQETEYKIALSSLKNPPKIVITDSQAFEKINKETPEDIPLTGFSVLMARYKGILGHALKGAYSIDSLKDGDKVLIAEACTHKRQCKDIGTIKMPAWLSGYTKKELSFDFSSGKSFPQNLSEYSLIIQCGGCMITEREVKARYIAAETASVPITNYGTAIAHMHGILKRAVAPFSDTLK